MNKKEQRIRERLKVGMVLKNYNTVAKVLEVKPTRGAYRKYHIKELERYCKYERDGHKYIVTEVYDKPFPKIDGRRNNGGNNTKYEDLLDRLIINTLIDYDGYIEESHAQFINLLMITENGYNQVYHMGYAGFAKANNIPKGLVMVYQQKMNKILRTATRTSLNRLQRQDIIKYNIEIIILDNKSNKRFATTKENTRIKAIEKEIYGNKTLGITPFKVSTQPRIARQFINIISNKLNIQRYWRVYSIKMVDKNKDYVKLDKDDLINRFIKSTIQNTKNKRSFYEEGKTFKPYASQQHIKNIDKLTKLMWKLPADYRTEKERNITSLSNTYHMQKEHLDRCISNYGLNDMDYQDGLPF